MKDSNWQQKEKRELFCKCVNTYIMKAGADKDPILTTILGFAREVVDEAFNLFPNEDEEKQEDFPFPKKDNDKE